MTSVSTHVLDVHGGIPASGVTIDVLRQIDGQWQTIKSLVTNRDGRCDERVLTDAAIGTYELVFHIGDYYEARGIELPKPAFLQQVPVRFSVAEVDGHYHVPLIVSPWNYQVYRGS